MDKERRQFEEKHFVEDVGLFFEQEGLPRMAGRILGWLLLSDPPHQSTDELAQVLQASKGSISTMTRLLIQADLVERVALPGMRRDHFRLRPGAWSHVIKQELFRACATRQLAERGLELLDSRDADLIDRLKEIATCMLFWRRNTRRCSRNGKENARNRRGKRSLSRRNESGLAGSETVPRTARCHFERSE